MLIPEIAAVLLDEVYSPRCEPPWSWDELVHKTEDAEYNSAAEWGFLLKAPQDASNTDAATSPHVPTTSAAAKSVVDNETRATSWPSPSDLPPPPDRDDLSLAKIVGTQRRGNNLERFALKLRILDGTHVGMTKTWWLDWPPTPRSEERWQHLATALGLDQIRDPRIETWQREIRVELTKRADGVVEIRRVYPAT